MFFVRHLLTFLLLMFPLPRRRIRGKGSIVMAGAEAAFLPLDLFDKVIGMQCEYFTSYSSFLRYLSET